MFLVIMVIDYKLDGDKGNVFQPGLDMDSQHSVQGFVLGIPGMLGCCILCSTSSGPQWHCISQSHTNAGLSALLYCSDSTDACLYIRHSKETPYGVPGNYSL